MSRPRARALMAKWFWLVPAIVAGALAVGGGYFFLAYVPGQRRDLEREWRARLTNQADGRQSVIADWVDRERSEAVMLGRNPAITECLADAGRCRGHGSASAVLESGVRALGYRGIALLDGTGRLVAGANGADSAFRVVARLVLASGAPFTDMVRTGGGPLVMFATPVTSAPGHGAGVVVIAADLDQRSYRILDLPFPARTFETVLVRSDGDSILYLSRLRHDTARPMTLRLPQSRYRLAAMAALSGATYGRYLDYRGEEVLAALRPIPGTPWAMLVKVDLAEAFAGYSARITRLALIWASLAAATAGVFLVLWWGLRQGDQASRSSGRARFAELLDHARDTILVIGPDGRVRDVNAQAVLLSGRDRSAIIGRHVIDDLRPPEEREAGRAQVARVQAEGEATYETVALAVSGERIPVEASVRVAELDGERVTVAVIRDLRERRTTEARLARLNRILRTTSGINQLIIRETDPQRVLAEACRIAVEEGGFLLAWVGEADPSGVVRPVASAGAVAYLDAISVRWDAGKLAQGPVGRAFREQQTVARGPVAGDAAFAPWSDAARRAGIQSLAATPLRTQGRVTHVLALYSTNPEEFDPEIVALVEEMGGDLAFALDAIARREELAAAQVAVARSAAALQQAAEAAIITDAAGTIVDVNPAFERITGYRRDEVVGRNPRLLKSGHQDDAFYAEMWATLGRGDVFSGEVVNRAKNGSLYTAEVAISPVRDSDGRVVHYVGLQRDVTRERALDAQLREAQRVKAIGQFTGGIAHDFNNLLSVVLVNVSLAGAELAPEAFAVRGYLRDIEQATLRGSAMVRKLLAFGRRERLDMAPADLGATVSEVVNVLRRVVPESIDIRSDVAAPLPAVKADVGAFEQILINLATNARDAMPQGGVFHIGVNHVAVGERGAGSVADVRAGDYVVVSVSDTGSGMDLATQSHIFEPFYTTKEVGYGTGLGLAMVFGIMQQHQGYVRVESAPGAGATFRLYFPALKHPLPDPTPATVATAAASVAHGRGETILLVEDEALVRLAASRVLERNGYVVVTADDGEAGWQQFREIGPTVALVITDAVMPRLGGYELIARIRATGSRVPCLVSSGYGPGNVGAGDDPGIPVLGKPWQPSELLAAIRELLEVPAPPAPS